MSMRYKGSRLSATANTPTSLTASGAWTLQQQMQANGTSTWPFVRDPQFNYVTMLLHGDGSAGASNGSGGGVTPTVTNFNEDASTNNFNVTINGDARSNNFTPYQAGYYSNYFDGTSGQYLNAPANTVFNFGTGDFTVEAWVYPTSTSGTRPIIEVRTTGGANGFALLSQSGATTLNVFTNSAFVGASTNSLTLNAWNHVALTRSTNTWTYWINGVSGGSFTNSSTQSDGGTTGPKIGGSTTSGEIWIGFISNARITKGAALYSTTFTPSTTPLTTTVSSGTVSLLTSQSNRFIDNSVNAFTITVNGSPQVAPAQPFTLPSSVATYGSGYFDGTGDYLTGSNNSVFAVGTGNFTVEAWVYPTAFSAYRAVFDTRTTLSNGGMDLGLANSSAGVWGLYKGSAVTVVQSSTNLTLNTWQHIAAVRSGSTVTLYLNGVNVGSATDAQNFSEQGCNIARTFDGYVWSGYITDLRFASSAVYTTAFTPPTSPLTAITNTQLLTTQYNGGGNNSGFKDSSQNNFAITRNGNTTQGTFAPYGSNWSNYFEPSTYNLFTIANATQFNLSGGAFTIEGWINPLGIYSSSGSLQGYNSIIQKRGYASNPAWGVYLNTGNGYLGFFNGTNYQSTTAPTANVWNHFAAVYDGTNISLYLNGVRVLSPTTMTNTDYNESIYIGAFLTSGAYEYLRGYISNLRVTKGGALYSGSTYTVPTGALTTTVSAGTVSLLTCQSNRFIDNSTYNATLTVTNAPSVQRFSPFANATAYNPATTGGSAYFDGSGDYLVTPSSSAFNLDGNFTIDLWVYFTGNPYGGGASKEYFQSTTTNGGIAFLITGTQLKVSRTGVGDDLTVSYTTIANQWYHFAIVRSSGTMAIYANGVSLGTASVSSNYPTSALQTVSGNNGYLCDWRIVKGTALYSGNFTPPTAPLTPTANTSLLLSNTNSAILDQSMMNNLETVGNAQISTSVVKYGTASMYFDGTDDVISFKNNPSFAFGTGSFTIEFWINGPLNNDKFILEGRNAIGTMHITTGGYLSTAGVLRYVGSSTIVSSNVITDSTWHHCAIVRNGSSNITLYVDGVSVGTGTDTTNYTTTTGTFDGIGGRAGVGNYLTAYIDDFRITKGYARYTTTFTPPTQALPNG